VAPRSSQVSLAILAAVALPLIVLNYDHGRAYYDQLTYHHPAIQHFAAGGSLRDYSSATTPGYHLILAAIAAWVSPSERVLKLAGFLMSAVLVWMMSERLSRTLPRPVYVVMLLSPLLVSIYFMPAAIWLLPDNLAWLSVFCLLLLAERFRDTAIWYVQVSAALLAAVLVRQSNLWLCLVACTAAATAQGPGATALAVRRLGKTLLASLPALGMLIYFMSLWGGAVPPAFADQHSSFNPAAVPYFLSVVAFYGAFYLPLIWSQATVELKTRSPRLLGWGALLGLCVALGTATDWNPDEGRVSGLWNLARVLPAFEHRSLLITVLSALGGAMGGLWLLLARKPLRWIAIAAASGFVAAQCFNHFVYERYFAGLVFFLIILLTVEALPRSPPAAAAWAGPVLLAVLNAAIFVAALR
jgi:hypothetical protein